MKRLLYILLLACGVLMIDSCDEVSLEERTTYVEPPEVGRAVLIEDYTGQYCVNCPRATDEIERLVAEYGDSVVIAVAIHSGPFSKSKGEPSPLYTAVGDEYFGRWGLSGQPVGLVDRLFSSMPFSYTDWGGGVNYELAYKAPVAFVVTSDYDEGSGQVNVEVQTIGLDSTAIAGHLQVWLVEDSIDSFQYMPDGTVSEHYNHMHVFRASVNDPWGDAVSVGHGEVARNAYALRLDASWVPEHCALVTFLFDDEGVRQVTKTKLINN